MPDLSNRKKEILKAVIDDYIATASPVSSQDVKDRYLPEVSSATIRSELASLEELGYLTQPHVSAGRVPSNAAYRLYANELMPNKPLTKSDIGIIKEQFDNRLLDIEDIVKKAAKIISDVTNYTSVIVLKDDDIVIRSIKIVELIENTALVIVITNKQVLKDSFITLPKSLESGAIDTANDMLNDMFAGKNINDLGDISGMVGDELGAFKSVFEDVLNIIKDKVKHESVVTEGEYKILDYPDGDRDSAKNFIRAIQKKDKLNDMIGGGDDISFSVKIGKEDVGDLDNCAVVSAKYTLNGREIGRAGVIGPVRMDYGKVYSVLNYVCKILDKMAK